MLQVKGAYKQFSGAGVVTKALALAGVAALAPIIVVVFALDMEAARLLAVVASIVSAAAMIGLAFTLRPVLRVAAQLNARSGVTGGRSANDSAQRLQANVEAIVAKLEASAAPSAHPVTGLPVREDFLNSVRRELEASPAHGSLSLVRLANFDQIVAFDAAAAERLIATVARRLSAAVKSGRHIAHLDRDCFAVWFNVGPEEAAAELEALCYVLGQDLSDGDLIITPDLQLGSAIFPVDADEPGNLLNRAFVSLARPQRTEEGAIAFFAQPSAQEARRSFTIEQDLRRAIRRSELALQFQPFVDLAMGRVVGAEALLRWRTQTHASLSPTEVVRVLEEAGLVHEVGIWTLNAACRQMRAWREAGMSDVKVAVNVSAHQLRDPSFLTSVERTVAAHGLSPSCIELELTESAAMADVARTNAVFERLREMGFSLAIDDFGSGYSSLTYLRRLPFQKLKIDREFVTQVDQRADSRTICKALIDLTAGLELSVLAEGVERFEEVEVLRTMGCSTFQGYYFARPLPPEDFIATVSDAAWMARVCSRVHREREELRRRLP